MSTGNDFAFATSEIASSNERLARTPSIAKTTSKELLQGAGSQQEGGLVFLPVGRASISIKLLIASRRQSHS
jgi:hypothetical protein